MADLSELLAPWLLGAVSGTWPGAIPQPPAMSTAAGLLQRLLMWFPGDPTGPNQHLTGLSPAAGLTPPSDAVSALLAVAAGDMYLSLDGTTASATNGLHVPSGSLLRVIGVASLRGASLLQVAAGTVVDVIYFT